MLKVQNAGIDKFSLLKFHKELILDINDKRAFRDDELQDFIDFSQMHGRVILFGLTEIDDFNCDYQRAIYNSFDPSFGGLNQLIEKASKGVDYKDYSGWLIERFRFAERYFTREASEGEAELLFLAIVASLESYLQSEFAKVFLPLLIKIEDEVKLEVARIYGLDIPDAEKEKLLFEYLDKKQEESILLFSGDIMEGLNSEALSKALEAILALGLVANVLDTEIKKAQFGYLSNIAAFFSNSFRRVKETAFENIYSKRDLKADQASQISFNKNDFKLSLLAHPRAYFRSILYESSKDKTDNYKLVVPAFVQPSLNPKGVTNKYLGKIKTFDQWSKTEGVQNINVVNGLGLHHGSQEYYLPIIL